MAYTFYLDYVNGDDYNPADSWGAPVLSVADGVTNGTTTLTSVIGGFTSGMIGRKIMLWSGSTFRAYRTISGYINGNTVTMDNSVSAYVGLTVKVGGAMKTFTGMTNIPGTPAGGDTLKVAKSSDPTSCGINSTWTNLSKTITLASILTANIDLCESGWTAGVNVTLTHDATRKQGSYSVKLVTGAGVGAAQKLAYKTLALTDFSSYQQISFWIRNNAAIASGLLQIKLCSDVSGDVPVDTLNIPAIPSSSRFVAFALDKGSALGAAIQSVAIYCTAAYASQTSYFDNIIACKAPGNDALTLVSLIGKNGSNYDWYAIQSIDGITILLDNDVQCLASAGRGYSGTTETVILYKREPILTTMVASTSTVVQQAQFPGGSDNQNNIEGGYNILTDIQDGETYYCGQNGAGYGLSISNPYMNWNRLSFYRYSCGIYCASMTRNIFNSIYNISNNSSYGIYFSGLTNKMNYNLSIKNINNNSGDGLRLESTRCIFNINNIRNNMGRGISLTSIYNTFNMGYIVNNGIQGIYLADNASGNIIKNCTTSYNAAGISNNAGYNYLYGCTINDTIEDNSSSYYQDSRLFSQNQDNILDNHYIYTDFGTINSDSSIRHTASGISWRLSMPNNSRKSYYPLDLTVARIACNANKLVTVKGWFKKSHSTKIVAQLVCQGGQIAGVSSDVIATSADNTNWQELTITFTPTEIGVVEIKARTYLTINSAVDYINVDDLTISQAS